MRIRGLLLLFASLLALSTIAQDHRTTVENYISNHLEELGLDPADADKWVVSDAYETTHLDANHIHIQQRINGIDIFNGVCNFTTDRTGKIIHTAGRLIGGLAQKTAAASFEVDESTAEHAALTHLELQQSDIAKLQINAVYFPLEDGRIIAGWHLVLHTEDKQHVWNLIVDASNGHIASQWDQVLHCSFHAPMCAEQHVQEQQIERRRSIVRPEETGTVGTQRSGGTYNVFAIPVESPNHGPRILLTGPEDSIASPYGWHDNNGQPGADFTITRGNNVFAFEDADNNGQAGYSPEGGPGLNFDFPFADSVAPIVNQDAALTNLFYMNNMIHDILYAYGFDEPSGNFQANNYGNGGTGGDAVWAQGFDGGGLNNATFFTPVDGQNPSMQMFLWNTAGTQEFLTINSPSAIAGGYVTTDATFGPGIPSEPITADVVLYEDGMAPFNDACELPTNEGALSGKIALIDRNECTFVDKITRAQNAGAVGVIMVNNVIGAPVTMGGSSGAINIPSVMITIQAGDLIKDQLADGQTVNATIVDETSGTNLLDGNFDNAIIAHEYGHGISNRLIGGRFNTNCLNNNEQMGEGWSDFYGILLTMDINADNPVYRPVGTYVTRENIDGFGIRPSAYDTTMSVNPFTYGNVGDASISVPHGVGFIWCTMLWDLTWALIDEYGFDPDVAYGTGGNNMALQLVTDGLKLTSCSPGFVNGRDAILQADQMNYSGANQCLIWEVFARRGLGYSASQGGAFNVNDGTEAFDLPPSCQSGQDILEADFLADITVSCDGAVLFTDESTGNPTSWTWDFGDGNSSGDQNPEHQYTNEGTYTVTLTVSTDSETDDVVYTDLVTVVFATEPTTESDVTVCTGESASLSANGANYYTWYNASSIVIAEGPEYVSEPLSASTTFYVSNSVFIDEITCISDLVPIDVTVAEAEFTADESGLTVSFSDASVNATSWSWDFGDGNASGEQSPEHTYAAPGMYTVTLTIDGICSSMLEVNAVSTGLADDLAAAGISLVPNPAAKRTTLISSIPFPENAEVELIGVDGRTHLAVVIAGNSREVVIDLSDIADGIYHLVVLHNGEPVAQRKLVVTGNP